jgi:Flp pilus assembly protein TadG
VAVEFSLVAIIFFTVVFGTLELARIEYLINTLEEVTRRAAAAAANTDYRDTTKLEKLQADAVFRDSLGPLALGHPVTSDHVKIDYLSVSKATWDLVHMSALPACPAGSWRIRTSSGSGLTAGTGNTPVTIRMKRRKTSVSSFRSRIVFLRDRLALWSLAFHSACERESLRSASVCPFTANLNLARVCSNGSFSRYVPSACSSHLMNCLYSFTDLASP